MTWARLRTCAAVKWPPVVHNELLVVLGGKWSFCSTSPGLMGLILLTARGTDGPLKMVACKCFLATDFFPAMSLGWYCGSIIVDHNTSATWAIQLEALLARPLCFFSIALTSAQSSMPHSGTGPKVGPGGAGSNLWWRRRHLPSPFLESKPVQLFGSLGPRLAAIQSRNSYNS